MYNIKKNEGLKSSSKLTAIDLFCGCGGSTLGLKKAGFHVLGAVDLDPLSIMTYKANHKNVAVWEKDIYDLDPNEMHNVLGLKKKRLDLLSGCPPCQGFSKLRNLNGAIQVEDSRNDLLYEFIRFVEILYPRAVIIENVPGLVDNKKFYSFIKGMEDIGYIGKYKILDSADYGVPQRRRRLIYIAGCGFSIPFAEKSKQYIMVKDAIGKLPKSGKSGDPLHDIPEHRSPKVMEMIRRIPKNGGSRTDLPEEYQLDCHKRCNGFKDVYGRMSWDNFSPTITSGCFNPSKGRFLHPEEDRAITLREAALLQGFPYQYKFPTNNKSAVGLMIGNALPPEFVRRHALEIKKSILVEKSIHGGVFNN